VLKYGHQSLSTFGIGKELSRKQWLHLAGQLLQKGYLERDEHGSLKLTPQARQALKERQPIQGTLLEERESVKLAGRAKTRAYDEKLFELLRARRKELAEEAHVPPYVIFSDRTLVDMASSYPTNTHQILEVYGMGKIKFERYGQVFLDLIQTYCQENQIQPQAGSRPLARDPELLPAKKPRYVEVGELFNQGFSVEQIMSRYGVQQGTVIGHLSRYAQSGQALNNLAGLPATTLPASLQEQVEAAFERLGTQALRPVYDALEGGVSFDDLHILRLRYLHHIQSRSAPAPEDPQSTDSFPP
jgi:ATP-dependent DNA helicase RecQ